MLFHTSLFSSIDVLMYRGIVYLILSSIVSAILMLGAKHLFKYLNISIKDIILMFMLFSCINMVIFTLIPVTVERSVSVFMLSYMEQSKGGGYFQKMILEKLLLIHILMTLKLLINVSTNRSFLEIYILMK